MKKVSLLLAVTAIFLCAAGLSACAPAEWEEGKLRVVATTTMLADLARNIGKDRADVKGLMGAGIDPHLYQASAGDVKLMNGAELVIYNGLHLEGKMADIFGQLGGNRDVTVVCAADGIDKSELLSDENNPTVFDPHIWFDAELWKSAAREVCGGFTECDPENAEYYQSNLDDYLGELDELHNYVLSRAAELPEEQRVLITAHDAFRYFGRAYGFEVRGLQGISTVSEAGIGDINELADFIAERRVRAIFVETSIPVKNIESLRSAAAAKGFSVEIGGELYSDSLGDEAHGTETYILTFKANIDTIVEALKTENG